LAGAEFFKDHSDMCVIWPGNGKWKNQRLFVKFKFWNYCKGKSRNEVILL